MFFKVYTLSDQWLFQSFVSRVIFLSSQIAIYEQILPDVIF